MDKKTPNTTYRQLVHMVYGQLFSIQHMDKLSICCTKKVFAHTTYGQVVNMFYGKKIYVHTTYRQLVHMFYGQKVFVHITYVQVVYICHIDKDMSYNKEQVHNESIDMTYLRKRCINIAPTGHDI